MKIQTKLRNKSKDFIHSIGSRIRSSSYALFMIAVLNGSYLSQTFVCGGSMIAPGSSPGALPNANCGASSTAYTTKYRLQSFYVPTANDPLITVNITFHIFNNNSGSGNYQPSGTTFTDINYIANTIHNGYERYSDPRSANYTVAGFTCPHISDSRVNYVVTNIYFYNNTTMFTANDNTLMTWLNANYPDRLKEGLPVMFNTGGITPGALGQAGSWNGNAYVHTAAVPGQGPWFVTQHLRHEIGHCMGWYHTYNPSCCSEFQVGNVCGTDDFLSDVFPINNPNCPSNTHPCNTCDEVPGNGTMASNNTMCGDPSNQWTSPLQMGRRIRNLHLIGTGVRQYAKETVSDHAHPWLITSNETWDFDIQMYRDIVVKTGNTLNITCRVAMATDGKIIVEKGAKLLIDGGEVTSWCKKVPIGNLTNTALWKGVEIAGNPSLNQTINNTTGLCANQGVVEIKNGGTISYAQKGIITSTTTAAGVWQNNTSGGIVIANGANFINNIYDIIFYKYQLGGVSSRIINSSFRTTSVIGINGSNAIIKPAEHIKLFENSGLNFQGCLFECVTGAYSLNDCGIGIYATDSHFSADQYCSTPACTSSTRGTFQNLEMGTYIDNSNPLYTGQIRNCDFYDNRKAVLVENSNYLLLANNTISMAGPYASLSTGIYLCKSKYYTVKNNTINGSNKLGVGAIAFDSQNGAHQLYRNTFTDCNTGILCVDNNGGLSGSNGLKMNCNVFNSISTKLNSYDIALTNSLSSVSAIQSYQSSPTISNGKHFVRNLYGAIPNNQNYWMKTKFYVTNQNSQIIYHGSTPTGADNPNLGSSLASPQVNVITSTTPFNYALDCPANSTSTGGDPPTSKLVMLNNMNNYITSLKSSNINNENDFEIQTTVSSKLNLFLSDTLTESNDSVVAIIDQNQGEMEDADIQLIFAYMHKGDYATAASKVASLPLSRNDWKILLNKVLDIKTSADGVYSLLADASGTSLLTSYATTEGMDGQATAQALLRFVFDTEYLYPYPLPPAEGEGSRITDLTELQSENTSIVNNSEVSVYPNPAQTGVTISKVNFEGTMKVELKDPLGKIIFTGTMSKNNDLYVPLTDLSNGVYFLSLTDLYKKVIYRSKLVKQD